MRKALIVWGGWPGHDPDLCASMIRGWLVDEGFEVRIETSAEVFGESFIHDLDLVIPIYTMSTIQKPHALNLCEAVKSGVGLAGHHGGMCDAFRDSVDYQFMCGGPVGRPPRQHHRLPGRHHEAGRSDHERHRGL